MAANRTNAGARPPREGSALCQGVIACGSRGKPMRTVTSAQPRAIKQAVTVLTTTSKLAVPNPRP